MSRGLKRRLALIHFMEFMLIDGCHNITDNIREEVHSELLNCTTTVSAGNLIHKRVHIHTHICTCKTTEKGIIDLLPLMRVPVTSLCRDKANLTSPCLQRLAQPVILTSAWGAAGSAEPEEDRNNSRSERVSISTTSSPCGGLHESSRGEWESVLFLLCRLSPC